MKRKNIFQIAVSDFTFKRLFATEKNKKYLIFFLNALVEKYIGKIVDITYLPTEKYGLNMDEKRVFFDIACVDENNRRFIIEMQCARQAEFIDRTLFYLGRAISSDMAKGDRKYRLLPTYSVNILDFDLPELGDKNEYFHAYFFKDQNNKILTQKVGAFYFNLRNFAAQPDENSTDLQKWGYILKNMQYFDEGDYQKQKGIYRNVLDECRITNITPKEMEEYRKSVLDYEDVQDAVSFAADEALKKGIEKGRAEGMEKGRTETRFLIASNLLQQGLDIPTIVKATGLTEAEILMVRG